MPPTAEPLPAPQVLAHLASIREVLEAQWMTRLGAATRPLTPIESFVEGCVTAESRPPIRPGSFRMTTAGIRCCANCHATYPAVHPICPLCNGSRDPTGGSMNLQPGWLERQCEAARLDVASWPEWMRRESQRVYAVTFSGDGEPVWAASEKAAELRAMRRDGQV